jgi:uncharacterized OB-fold protein
MLSPVKIWRNQKKVASLIGKRGTIVSWTLIRVPPADFSSLAPYPVALIVFDGGGSMMAQVVDIEMKCLKKGQRVATVVRRVTKASDDGVIPYGIKAIPIE